MGKFLGALGGNLEKTQLHQLWILLENKIIILEVLETFFFSFSQFKKCPQRNGMFHHSRVQSNRR